MSIDKHTDNLYNSIRTLIENAKSGIVRNINRTMVLTYFEIGRTIVEHEQNGNYRADYSKELLSNISKKLMKEFGKGYSVSNLQYFRKFYMIYQGRIQQTLSGELRQFVTIHQTASVELGNSFSLGWSHYVTLLKIQDKDERDFYEIESAKGNWSVRELQRQFNSSLYERLALSRDKDAIKELATEGRVMENPGDALKNHYVLEFLGLKEDARYSETDLENAIINKLEHFMMELGNGFLFEARQKRLSFETDNFFVDLVFYNRLLRCYVLMDLKIGKLAHQDIGQMQMYVNFYNRKIKLPDENPTIGIILCKEENKTVVEFTLPEDNNSIFAKEYKLYLPSKEQLKKQLE